jgi:hypothetical protein
MVECFDGTCADSLEDCESGCPAGTIEDCSGDGDCGYETWLGDGYCDGSAQQYGIDNCCYDLDGGDCTEEECAGGRAADYGVKTQNFKKAEEPTTLAFALVSHGRTVSMIKGDRPVALVDGREDMIQARLGDVYTPSNEPTEVRIGDQTNDSRAIYGNVHLYCDACLSGAPYDGYFTSQSSDITIYGMDAGSTVMVDVALCSDLSGMCSDAVGPVSAEAGVADGDDCVGGGDDGCDGAGSGDVNGDGSSDVLDIVQIVNVILGGSFEDECAAEAADVNGDGSADVLDIVQIVNGILGRSNVGDATHGKLIRSNDALRLEANGYIGGVQMTLSHGSEFSIELTDNALVADYRTVGSETILVIVAPIGEELFTHT